MILRREWIGGVHTQPESGPNTVHGIINVFDLIVLTASKEVISVVNAVSIIKTLK